MLGVRLSPEFETRLERIAVRTRRTKSDLAREALERFVDRFDLTEEAKRQSRRAAARGYGEDDRFWESVAAWDDDGA